MKWRLLSPDLLSSLIDRPERGAVTLGDVPTVVHSLVVVLHHHVLRAVLQVHRVHPHDTLHVVLHRPVHAAGGEQVYLNKADISLLKRPQN